MNKTLVIILLANVVMLSMSASVLDFLTGSNNIGRQENNGPKNCICNGPSCICCLDFNISFIDLGGPGCVRLKYLSAEEGIAINVSYGESLLHNEIVRGPDPAPTCLNIFAKLAQMCARFHELLPTDDGLRGCISLEPMLLGEPQLDLSIGCFRMGPNGMQIIESSNEVIKEQQPNEVVDTDKDAQVQGANGAQNVQGPESVAGYNAEDILAAVNESAEEGIAIISNWLGLNIAAGNETLAEKNDTIDTQNTYEATTNANNGHVVFA